MDQSHDTKLIADKCRETLKKLSSIPHTVFLFLCSWFLVLLVWLGITLYNPSSDSVIGLLLMPFGLVAYLSIPIVIIDLIIRYIKSRLKRAATQNRSETIK